VSYRRSTSTNLALHIPLEAAVNADAVERYKERQVGGWVRECGCAWLVRVFEGFYHLGHIGPRWKLLCATSNVQCSAGG